MSKFTKFGINLIKFSIITIFFLIQIFIYQYAKGIKIETEINEEIMENQEKIIPEEIQAQPEEKYIWQIKIDKISLTASIGEGTTKDVLNKYVGHFANTQTEKGNIGLAAHNRGYEVNYFEKIKLLKKGDEIQYKHNQYENTYEVVKNIIIKDTDWEYLENTEENQITLITCVENEPEFRRCIQAVEKEKEEIY